MKPLRWLQAVSYGLWSWFCIGLFMVFIYPFSEYSKTGKWMLARRRKKAEGKA